MADYPKELKGVKVTHLKQDESIVDEVQSNNTYVHIEQLDDNNYYAQIGGYTFIIKSESKIIMRVVSYS